MKRIIAVTGFILQGENTFYANKEDGERKAVFDERLRMIKSGIGIKQHSDPVGALLQDEELLQSVAALVYTEKEETENG